MNNPVKHEVLRDIVNSVFGVDIMAKSGKREVVDGRYVFSKILIGDGYSRTEIGRILKKHHTTVLHYERECDNAMLNIRALRNRYFEVLNRYNGIDANMTTSMTYHQIVDKISSLQKELEQMVSYKKWYEEAYGNPTA